jgi:hypothetical protein
MGTVAITFHGAHRVSAHQCEVFSVKGWAGGAKDRWTGNSFAVVRLTLKSSCCDVT